MIPIVIVCFNNWKYVKNTIEQIKKINSKYVSKIIVMDNKSDDPDTIIFLKNYRVRVNYRTENLGPWVWLHQDFYYSLPNKFILTDPDLEFNSKLPSNFIEIMSKLSDTYKCAKLGFAISVEDKKDMFQGIFIDNLNQTIYDHEGQYWKDKIPNSSFTLEGNEIVQSNSEINDFDLYKASIDTTFCLINKTYFKYDDKDVNIRIGGIFTCRHLPYYINNPIYTLEEQYEYYDKAKHSCTKRVFMEYIYDNYDIEKIKLN